MEGASVGRVAQVQHNVTSSNVSATTDFFQPADGSQSTFFVSICFERTFPLDCFQMLPYLLKNQI